MGAKRSLSASVRGEMRDSSADSPKLQRASKRNYKVPGDDSEDSDRMTLRHDKSRLRTTGIPAKETNSELVSSLKSCVNDKDGLHSSFLQDEVICKKKITASKTHVKRKATELSEMNIDKKTDQDSGSSGKSTKGKKSYEGSNIQENLELTIDPEIITESTKIKGKTITQTKKKFSSKTRGKITINTLKANLLPDEPWSVLTHMKPQKEWTPYNPKTMRPPPIDSDTAHVKLVSWNVNGLRALLKQEGFSALQLVLKEEFDVLCLQETKLQEKDVDAIKKSFFEGYDNSYWTCSVSKLGYSGTAIISRINPHSVCYGLGISDHDSEGRLVTVEFDSFYLLCGYVPNSGDSLKRLSYRTTQWDPSLSNYMRELERSKPVILTGDLNCARQEIDIWNPAGNKRSAGFTDEERESFQINFLDRGFVDTFREQHPNAVGYTYWGYRHGGRKTNKGWRLDYFLASQSISNQVYDSYILPEVGGSDHCPIGLVLKL